MPNSSPPPGSDEEPPPKPRSFRLILGALIALAVGSRALLIALLPMNTEDEMKLQRGDEQFYFLSAHSIVEQLAYVEKNLLAYRPPLYPAFVALCLALFPEPTVGLQILQNLSFLAVVAALAWIASRAGGRVAAAVTAGLLLIHPLWLTLPQTAYSETLFLLLLTGALVLLCRVEDGRSKPWAAPAMGVLIGLSALTREIGLVVGVLAVILFARGALPRLGRSATLRSSAAILGAALLVVGAWTVRNAVAFHEFIPIATNGPINIYVGNNPRSTGDISWSLPPRAWRIWDTPSELGKNEIEAMRIAGAEGKQYILDHPGLTAKSWSAKLLRFWFPPPMGPTGKVAPGPVHYARSAFFVVYTLLAGLGCWLHRRALLAQVIVVASVVASLVQMMTMVNLRYRAPFDALFAIPVAWALLHLVERARAARSRAPSA